MRYYNIAYKEIYIIEILLYCKTSLYQTNWEWRVSDYG